MRKAKTIRDYSLSWFPSSPIAVAYKGPLCSSLISALVDQLWVCVGSSTE